MRAVAGDGESLPRTPSNVDEPAIDFITRAESGPWNPPRSSPRQISEETLSAGRQARPRHRSGPSAYDSVSGVPARSGELACSGEPPGAAQSAPLVGPPARPPTRRRSEPWSWDSVATRLDGLDPASERPYPISRRALLRTQGKTHLPCPRPFPSVDRRGSRGELHI